MKRIISILLILLLLSCFSGCDPYYNRYPGLKSDRWYCEEIDFEFSYSYDEKGHLIPQSYPLVWDNMEYRVFVSFHVSYFYIDIDNGDDMVDLDEQLVRGTWHYQDDSLVFVISEDNLFGGQYKELVFTPME